MAGTLSSHALLKTSLAVLLLVLLFLSCPPRAHAAQPQTIPALQQWTDAPGQFTFGPQTRIVLDQTVDSDLAYTAATFADDLQHQTGLSIGTVSASAPAAGDIFLTFATDPRIGNEGYLLDIGDHIVISAATTAGVFYGTRSILQMLHQSPTIAAGSAVDWPNYPERALMVDVGRKFFSMDFLRGHIRELAYLKLNYFHLHLSDEDAEGGYGFRLESTTHPEVTSAEHYTPAQIQELLSLADQYHVMIVPEIDVPAHATALLAAHPELRLPGRTDKIDLSNPASYTLISDLLNEFLPLFPAPYWHTGGDEYLGASEYANYPQLATYAKTLYGPTANGPDVYIGFVDGINAIVKAHGKQLRCWNDIYGVSGSVKTPDSDIVMELWTTSISPQNALARGHQVVNAQSWTLYYVLGRDWATNDPASTVNLYEQWAPNKQWVESVNTTNWTITWGPDLEPLTPGLLGGKFHVWCDFPSAQTEFQVTSGIGPHLRGLAQNAWGSPRLVPQYVAFVPISDAIGHAPNFAPELNMTPRSSSATVSAGGTAQFVVDVASDSSEPLTLSCTSSAPHSVCGVDPASMVVTPGTPAVVSVSVHTTARSSAAVHSSPLLGIPPFAVLAGLLFPFLGARALRNRSARARALALFASLALACLLSASACGGGGSPSPNPPPESGTPAGNYVVVLHGASAMVSRDLPLTLTVE